MVEIKSIKSTQPPLVAAPTTTETHKILPLQPIKFIPQPHPKKKNTHTHTHTQHQPERLRPPAVIPTTTQKKKLIATTHKTTTTITTGTTHFGA